jgi:organic radical activating enzyme
MSEKRIFPIKNDPACLLKWSWSTVLFNSGSTSSCHRTHRYKIDPDNFDQFHNLPEKLRDRQMMLDGNWPGFGCEYCREIERAGETSDRQFQLAQQQDPGLTPPELYNDNRALSVTPTILEVWFKNTCNMACVYCGPHHSSLWEDENRKYGNLTVSPSKVLDKYATFQSQTNPDYEKMIASLWSYLDHDQRYLTLRRFHILGGEPFLLDELNECLDFWDAHPNPDLVISIITNLNVPPKIFQKYINRFEQLVKQKKIWKLQITGSIDGWGPEIEYARYGLNTQNWESNFKSLLDKPWATLSINAVISALTIKILPALVVKMNEWNSMRPADAESIIFSYNLSGPIDDPRYFGPGVFDKDFELALSMLSQESELEIGIHQALNSIARTISKSSRDVKKIDELKTYLDNLDVRRKTNWRATFPWLDHNFE